MGKQLIFLFSFIVLPSISTTYRVFSLVDTPACTGDSFGISMGSLSPNSSGILVASRDVASLPGMHCVVTLRPPFSGGVVISIKSIDLQPYSSNRSECQNYLQISPIAEEGGTAKLCGYTMDEYEFKSYSNWDDTKITFHTSNTTLPSTNTAFQITFTAVREAIGWTSKQETTCHNNRRIWKGLTCDGHNNCGDLSDEISNEISLCSAMSAIESIAVIVSTIVGSLILLIIIVYIRGPKLTQQIERLSRQNTESPFTTTRNQRQPNTNAEESSSSRAGTVRDANLVSGIVSRPSRDSTSNLLSFWTESDVNPEEPPPAYDEVQGLDVAPVTYISVDGHSAVQR